MLLTDISIITVGYSSQNTLPALLLSLKKQEGCKFEFIYVENAAHDSSCQIVKTHFPEAKIIESAINLGFSKACNLGATKAKSEYLLFLNPDCEIKTIDTLKKMLEYMRKYPEVGICGPFLTNINDQDQNNTFMTYFGEQYFSNHFSLLPGKTAWISGAAIMIPKKIFISIGRFDESYFMYSEDVDICLKTRKAGYHIALVPRTNIKHLGGASSSKIWTNAKTMYQAELALAIFTSKHYTPAQHIYIWKRRCIKQIGAFIRHFLLFKKKNCTRDLLKYKAARIALK